VVITGVRRIGKSSILNVFLDEISYPKKTSCIAKETLLLPEVREFKLEEANKVLLMLKQVNAIVQEFWE